MNSQLDHIKALEGFRGFCILSVMLHNLFPYQVEMHGVFAKIMREIAGAGWIGVQWFFVLSGFLITRILISTPLTLATIKQFYIRRSLRIFPIYYFVLIVLFILLPAVGITYPGTGNAIEHSAWFWLYVSNLSGLFGLQDLGLSHLWSLAVEEQFYLVWPWVILWVGIRNLALVCVLLIGSAIVARYVISVRFPEAAESLNYVTTFVRWDALAFGALVAWLTGTPRADALTKNTLVVMTVFLGAWFVVAFILMTDFKAVGTGIVLLNQTLAALMGVVIILASLNADKWKWHWLKRILENKVACHLGRYSYAIYLLHLIVAVGILHFRSELSRLFGVDNGSLESELILLVVVLMLIYVLARVSWVLIETPFLKLKRHFN